MRFSSALISATVLHFALPPFLRPRLSSPLLFQIGSAFSASACTRKQLKTHRGASGNVGPRKYPLHASTRYDVCVYVCGSALRDGIIRVGRSQRAARLHDTGRPSRGTRLATPAPQSAYSRRRPIAARRPNSGSTADGFRATDGLFTVDSPVRDRKMRLRERERRSRVESETSSA